MYNTLIVGCGKIAGGVPSSGVETHAGAIMSERRLALAACVDSDIRKAREFAGAYQCGAYDDLTLALGENCIDLVSVCTPDTTHFSIAKEVILSPSAPQVVFLEKPACTTQDEYRELKELGKKHGVLIVINHTRRFSSKYQLLRELICTEQLGQVYRVNATYYSGWFHNGTHVVDTLSFLLDDMIEWRHLNDVIVSPYSGDPTLELTGYLGKSRAKVVVSAIDESLFQLFDFDIWCRDGRLRIEDFGSRISMERQVINAIGERVLEPVPLELPSDEKSEMQIAIGQISDYLDTEDSNPLSPVLLESIESTMQILWNGRDLYN